MHVHTYVVLYLCKKKKKKLKTSGANMCTRVKTEIKEREKSTEMYMQYFYIDSFQFFEIKGWLVSNYSFINLAFNFASFCWGFCNNEQNHHDYMNYRLHHDYLTIF